MGKWVQSPIGQRSNKTDILIFTSMKFLKYMPYALCMGALISLTACGDEDDEPVIDPIVGPSVPGGAEIEEYTPEESKEYISGVATDFMGKFKADEQKDIIDLANYFADNFGDLELPAEFEFECEEDQMDEAKASANRFNPARYMKALGRGLAGNPSELTRASYHYTYNINFNRVAGIYKPGNDDMWVKVSDSKDLVFEFTGKSGEACQLKVVASEGASNANINITDEWYEYWDDEVTKEEYEYRISLPNELTATLTQGGNQLAMSKVVSQVNVDGHTAQVSTSSRIANIDVVGTVNANDNEVAENSQIKVNGEVLVTTSAVVNGKNLCNLDRIQEALEDEEDLSNFITSGVASADILGKVQAVFNGTLNNSVINALDNWYDNWDYNSEAEAKAACENDIATLRKYINGTLHFENSKTVQATLDYVVMRDSWGSDYFEYWYDPALSFSDGSTLSFGDYFDDADRFPGVESTWNSLVDTYEKLFDR